MIRRCCDQCGENYASSSATIAARLVLPKREEFVQATIVVWNRDHEPTDICHACLLKILQDIVHRMGSWK